MGAVSIALYLGLNFLSGGNVIYDSVSALGWMIAFYYGLTGFACAWYYRKQLRDSSRNLWLRGILPATGGVMLFAALAKSVHDDWSPASSYTTWQIWFTHRQVGAAFVIGALTVALGLLLLLISLPFFRPFFRGAVLPHSPAPSERPGPGIVRPSHGATASVKEGLIPGDVRQQPTNEPPSEDHVPSSRHDTR